MKKTFALILATVLLVFCLCGAAVAADEGTLTQTGSCINYLWAGIGPRRVSAEQHADCSMNHAITYSTKLVFDDGTEYKVPTNKCDRIAPSAANSATGTMDAKCETCGTSTSLERSTNW